LTPAPPSSSVDALPVETFSESFTVSWTGADDAGGSGVAFYDVYVSTDGGSFAPFLVRTTETSATFTGEFDHTYSFYSVATDNVGHRQATPATAQATTMLVNLAPTAVPGGPYAVDEGDATTLDGSQSSDPNDAVALYEWDFDYDGVSFDVDATGVAPSFDATNLDGPDSRTVALRVQDVHGLLSEVATTTITIRNADPVITQFDVPETGTRAESLSLTAAAADPAGALDPLTFTWSITRPDASTFQLDGAEVSFTPMSSGEYAVALTVSDDDGGLDQRSALITVIHANTPPVANDDEVTTDEDTPLVIAVLDNDFDGDRDPLTVSSVTQGANGSVIINGDDTVTYTPDDDFHGGDAFTYTIHDGQGGEATATVSVTVNPVNDAPTAIVLSNAAVDENAPGAVIGEVTVIDPDAGDTHTLTVSDDRFEIVAGILKLKDGVALDFETAATILLQITAVDSGVPPKSLTEEFVIAVREVAESEHPWQNPDLRWDVNDDGVVTIHDLFEIVHALAIHRGAYALPEPGGAEGSPPPYLDVNGDDHVSVADLLETIQKLRDQLFARFIGEGEREDPLIPAPLFGLKSEPVSASRRKSDNAETGNLGAAFAGPSVTIDPRRGHSEILSDSDDDDWRLFDPVRESRLVGLDEVFAGELDELLD
jgi:hypothetical protein